MTALAPPVMTETEARERVDRVKSTITVAFGDLLALWRERAWLALGYESWDSLCDNEFGVRMGLPRDERREIVGDLRREGMSTRAIGSALGVSQATAWRDATDSDESVETPATVTSLDGRVRPATRPTARPAPDDDETPRYTDEEVLAYTADDADVIAATFRRNLLTAVIKVSELVQFPIERTAMLIKPEHAESIDRAERALTDWAAAVRRARSGLKIVKGGNQ